MRERFPFLYAERFWAMTIGALAIYGKLKGWLGEPEMALITTMTGALITIRTIDRATEQKILAQGVDTGEIKVATILKVPPTDSLTEIPTQKEIP